MTSNRIRRLNFRINTITLRVPALYSKMRTHKILDEGCGRRGGSRVAVGAAGARTDTSGVEHA